MKTVIHKDNMIFYLLACRFTDSLKK